jgi:alpha-L-rhamnosidase
MKGTTVTWLVTVPPNTTAHMPLPAGQQERFTIDGEAVANSKKLRLVSNVEGSSTYELPAGTYSFRVTEQ